MLASSSSTNQQQETPCSSYFQLGYCLRGDNCPCRHDCEAVPVTEQEFYFQWQVCEVFIDSYTLQHGSGDSSNTMVENNNNNTGKTALELERERIKRNIQLKNQQLEEQEEREQRRREKVEKRNRELREETERLEELKKQQQQQSFNSPEMASVVVEQIIVPTSEVPPESPVDSEWKLDDKYKNINWHCPRIPLNLKYHVPASFRQKVLDMLIQAYNTKFKEEKNATIRRQKSVVNAFESELSLYNSNKEKTGYWVNANAFMKKI
jgi:vacuolar-type H+-ATPase subunit I/STV1